ncbi:MAG TPA: AAA family ATPase [Candidatus Limnocylindrales bacterium]|nr:AAA family ATPase [Candidatus Limnocylindrales bacterium]
MRITHLQIRNLRRHRDLDLELDPGLTVVRGPNESGKTTIQRGLELALTRRVTSGAGDLDGLRTWGAGDDERPWVRLEFDQDDAEGNVLHGFVEKSFKGPRGSVTVNDGVGATTDPAEADVALAEITGIPSEAFFRSTASVRHHELDGLQRDEAALRDRLQASISGADRGTSRAKKKLERALFELNTKGEKNPGRIKATESVLAQETAAQRSGESALMQLETDRDTLSGARERRTEAEATLKERRSLLDKARMAERLIAEREAASERFERYRTAVQVGEEIGRMESAHPSRIALPTLREIVGKLREADIRIREIKAALAQEVQVQFEVEPPTPRAWRPTAIAALVIILLALAVAIADAVHALPHEIGELRIAPFGGNGIVIPGASLLAALLVLVAAVLGVLGRRQRIRALDFHRAKELRDAEIERRLRGRSQLEQELQMAEVMLQNQLAAIELPNVAAVEDLARQEEDHVGEILRKRAQLEGLVGREPVETLPQLRDAAAAEIEQKTAAIEHLGPIAKEARARERLEIEVADAERANDRARDDEAQARARVEQNPVDAEEVASHAERVAELTELLEAFQRRSRVYETTLKSIEAAETATLRTATRYLERRMVGDLDRVTGGRYKRVAVDDTNLGIRVYAPERHDWVDVTTLSQGTLDIIYLAARIGLVRLVTGDRRPPLILDDPFVTLDDERAKRALALLKEISRDFQVIYLTTSDRYDKAADAVRVLKAPVELTPDDAPERPASSDGGDADGATAAPGAAAQPESTPEAIPAT